MHRRVLWFGVGTLVVAYLLWSVTHATGPLATETTVGTPAATPIALGRSDRGSATLSAPARQATGADAPATLLLTTGRVKRKASIGASGFGLAPKEKVQLVRDAPDGSATTLATGRADEHGSFGGLAFQIPDTWPDGDQTIRVVGLASRREARAHLVVEPSTPGAEPNTYFGKPLSPVSFKGGGFRPGERVTVYFDSLDSAALGQFEADGNGLVQVRGIRVPPAAAGEHAFVLVGQASGAPVRIPFSVLPFAPWLSLTDYTPQPERSIGVVGHDFAPGEHIAVFLNAIQGSPVAEGTADRQGIARLDPAFAVPYQQRGKLTIVAVGSVSQTAATATLAVRPYTPTIALSTYAGPPGTLVTVTGKGFAHSEDVTVRLGEASPDGSGAPTLTVRSDRTGAFRSPQPLRIPDRAREGKLTLSVVGAHSQVPVATTFAVLPITPWIAPVPAAGRSGGAIALDGGGFEPREPVEIRVGTSATRPAVTVVADANGSLHHAGALAIPPEAAGQVPIQATGTKSGGQARATYTVIRS